MKWGWACESLAAGREGYARRDPPCGPDEQSATMSVFVFCQGGVYSAWRRCYTYRNDAGWSSQEARQAHNLEVAGSNPAPATNSNFLSVPHKSRCGMCLIWVGVSMGRPKVDIARLRELDRNGFLEFEDEVLGALEREEQARRQDKLEGQGNRKRSRRRTR